MARATHSGRVTTAKIWAGIAIHATMLLGELSFFYNAIVLAVGLRIITVG